MNNLDDIITPTFNWLKEKNKVAIATVISTWGSAPRQVGGQMAINETGEIIGSVSGGCVENSVITEALDSLKDKKHRIKDYGITNDLAWEVGLACGGNLKILINPLENDDKIIFKAKKMIEDIVAEPEKGVIYKGKVVKTVDFGAFVNFLGAKDGLVHISELQNERTEKTTDVCKENDEVYVKVIGFDDRGKVKLSMKRVDQETGKDLEKD